ncbi:(3R)-3-hydroxyacyl-CoA dehydrogenase isoform X2 [Daktulosphaira vitifoliae]|uniref:(3R)-3-hydroxyacyl-CoA dehydrogenase isoform X2 n=1 Tax=Daktulosphaira vitifoliae TaxID=58002 RepID=UPI0021AACAB1|nr:(3R)-3-hydroxyacyl-CoA dehydrogenase isoform X2 [Daktulosphaira vitifoliae]XP_050542222.1 (3R)-3-hydroxyacyl-CoA dehydrogenase isoform X2 [Daktulosphaira vitifoliae]XP_050542223.1 (3R)-3-hydroxyacyl-CoA dehydrogenase isoform X2 [Daktulosphaira vitifoliae]
MLLGKLAFITGAGGGIGKAICKQMALEGAKVVAADVNINQVQSTIEDLKGGEHRSYQLDICDTDSVNNVIQQICSHYLAPPTILVNAAGITRDNFLLKMSVQDFERVFEVNMKGTFVVTQAVCKQLVEKNLSGSIVNIGSIVSQKGNIGQCNYSASKAAVEVFSKTVALEMAKYNIRCNTVLPGFTITPMTDIVPEKVKNYFKSAVPLGRFAVSEAFIRVCNLVGIS